MIMLLCECKLTNSTCEQSYTNTYSKTLLLRALRVCLMSAGKVTSSPIFTRASELHSLSPATVTTSPLPSPITATCKVPHTQKLSFKHKVLYLQYLHVYLESHTINKNCTLHTCVHPLIPRPELASYPGSSPAEAWVRG